MRLLLAEDDPVTQKTLTSLLTRWGYQVMTASDGQQALDCLQSDQSPHLAIIDWLMPKLDGVEVCRRIRQVRTNADQYLYLILLTVKNAKTDIVQGLQAGADDFLSKPFDPDELRVRLHVGERILNLDNQLRETNQLFHRQSRRDELTGLYNRRGLEDIWKRETSRIARSNAGLSLGIVDLDHFKNVNDQLGHLTGDEVLKECAQRIKDSLRKYDSVARFGGEEFLFLAPETNLDQALIIGERIRAAIGETPFTCQNGELNLSASIGVATWNLPENFEDLIWRADKAMYLAKQSGRNLVLAATELSSGQHAQTAILRSN